MTRKKGTTLAPVNTLREIERGSVPSGQTLLSPDNWCATAPARTVATERFFSA